MTDDAESLQGQGGEMLWCQAGSLPGLWKVVSGLEGLQRVVHGPAEQSVPSTGMGRAGRVTKSLCGGFGLSLPAPAPAGL